MRGVYQHDDNDCGLACILTVCKNFNIKVDERILRKEIYMGKDGLSLYGITKVLCEKGVNSYALECDIDELCQLYYADKKPIIIMIGEEDEFHYVVLYKMNSKKLCMWDPNKGKRIMRREKFEFVWSGYGVKITDVSYDKQDLVNKKLICFKILKEQNKAMFIILLFAIFLMVVSIIVTFTYREIIDGIKYGEQNLKKITFYFIMMGIGYVIMMMVMVIKERIVIFASKEMEIALNSHFLEALLNMPIQKREDYSSGGVLDRYYRLPMVVNTFSSVYSSVILEILSLVSGVYIMVNIDPVMFAMVNIIVISYIVCFYIAKGKLFVLSKFVIDRQSILTTHIKETVQNLISLKSFDCAKYISKIKGEILRLKVNESKLKYFDSLMGTVLQAVENITMLLIIAYGIYSINDGEMSLGTLLAFETFVGFFLSPVKNLLGILPSVQETILTFNKIEDILIFFDERNNEYVHTEADGEILLEHVDIAYGFDEPVLRDVSFKIGNQEKIFLMGTSGTGKSTLAKTMAGLVSYTKGRILYNGKQYIDISKRVLYLSQDTEIFSGTIRENILMWQECVDTELFEEILFNIGINKFMKLRGFTSESYLQENGMNLSGGERQRIAIARALMCDVPIYIFDEATSHLDVESERNILKYIREKLHDKVCIFITHNAQLPEENDKIIFIDNNRKVHCKKHNELLQNLEYKKMLNK